MQGDLIVFTLFSIPITIISLTWIVIISKHLFRSVASYRQNKRIFFPDERIRSRNQYNLETHIVKYILLLILICLELSEPISGTIYYFNTIGHDAWYYEIDSNYTVSSPEDCTTNKLLVELFISQNRCSQSCNSWDLIFIWQVASGVCFFITTLSILCRYLSARYLNHPYKRIVGYYAIWLCIQFILFLPALSKHTLGLANIAFLIISCVDWILLVKDTKRLKNTLEGHVKELQLHGSKERYNRERKLYVGYRISIIFLLSSLFFLLLEVALYNAIHCLATALSNKCVLHFMTNTQTIDRIREVYAMCFRVLYTLNSVLLSVHYILLVLPLHLATIVSCLVYCYKQRRGVKKEYLRYNYEIMQTLIEKRRQRRMK